MNFLVMVTVHSVPSNTLRDAGNMNLLVQCPRSIVCFANLIYVNRINSRGISRVFCDLRSQKTPRGILPVNSNLLVTGYCSLAYAETADMPETVTTVSIYTKTGRSQK